MSVPIPRAPSRTAALAGVLAGVLLLGACGDTDPPAGGDPVTSPSASTAPAPDADFTAEVRVGADEVTVTWSLTNTGTEALGVLDRVPAGSRGSAVDLSTSAAWVQPDGDDGIVLSQQVLGRPEGDDVARETLPVTGATLLEPGTTLDRTVTVPRPFVGSHPYGEDPGDPELLLPDDPTSVRFCLGVVADTRVLYETPRGELVADDQDANVALQHLFCSDPAPLT